MPFIFLGLGLLFFVVAVRGTHGDFFALLKSEFTGPNNFVVWAMAFVMIGAVGFWKPARPVAVGFIILLFLVLVLTQGVGFFDKFNAAIKNPVAPSVTPSGFGGPSGYGVPSTDPATVQRYGPGTLFPAPGTGHDTTVPSYIPGVY